MFCQYLHPVIAALCFRLLARCELSRPNTDKAVQLLMNLSADSHNRRILREAGAVEALVNIMRLAPLEPLLEHAMGALHNVMLTGQQWTHHDMRVHGRTYDVI